MNSTDLELDPSLRPSREELLAEFGEGDFSVQSLFEFCFVPVGRLSLLKELALDEDWGTGDVVLLKYLARHLRLEIEQGRYVWNEDQIVLRAGDLRSTTGVPIYVGLVRNFTSDENPWAMNWVGDRPRCSERPELAELSIWPELDPAAEIVLGFNVDHGERLMRIPSLAEASSQIQISALIGACHFALHRGLAVPHEHNAAPGYFLPIFLSSCADLSAAPDMVCSVFAHHNQTLIHAVLDPHIAYGPARAVVARSENLPNWLLEAWSAIEVETEDD
ncbi:MAG: hypothetical protein ACI8TQ_002223 [Planctomycetota bacterium]|jgi:hypothetical protein